MAEYSAGLAHLDKVAADAIKEGSTGRRAVHLINGAAIRPTPIDWLWGGWLAAGKLHILAGAPGTGKTALAEYIAGQLGKPLMVKQASDLVSKYVGDTEQNMARMFADAERDEAVLLLDEADSFLMDRRGAQRNYEVTEVNEMLQGMERFQGIFICTTNLMDRVDQAALRRFSFKIQFKPLTLEQRERMFVTEALQGDAERLTPELRQRLARMDQLCPGDYAAVRRQIDILGEELFPEEFIEQLEAEHRIKPEVRESRGMGFV